MGRWILHGEWYPDCVTRLFIRGKAIFKEQNNHDKAHVDGKILKLKGDAYHYSFDNLIHLISKYPRFGSAFLNDSKRKKKEFSVLETLARASWRFFRCYFIKKGFLDGYPGLFIALNQFYYTLFRYTLIYEDEAKNSSKE